MKRLLLVLLVAGVLLSGALVALRLMSRRSAPPSPTTDISATGEALPETGSRDTAVRASPAPGSDALSVACPESWLGLPDGDGDGLPDQVEAAYHTDEQNPDTDSDGFTDGDEIRAGYHPLKKEGNPRLDSDEDGLLDPEECQWKTDPFVADTDGDGFRDGDEVKNGFDPAVKGNGQGSDALPVRKAQQAEATLERLRPDPNSPNYTEGLAGILGQGQPTSKLGQTKVTPRQVEQALSTARLNTTLPNIPLAELTVGSSNTSADVRAYLGEVDASRPQDFSDPTAITNALTGAVSGNPAGIRALRGRLAAYENSLKAISVPPSAVEHHRTLVALTRFVSDRFAEVETSAARDPVKAYLALRSLQVGLVSNLQTLQAARTQLEELARA